METPQPSTSALRAGIRQLPRNVWAVSLTSFLMDISSEMVINVLPLFLSNVLGVKTNIIGVIEGVAEAIASLLKLFSGWLSDRVRGRKWLAVVGYGFSALTKPFFYFANTWEAVAGARWADRVGKGIRTAPRDALVADSIDAAPARAGLRLPPCSRHRRGHAGPAHRAGHRLGRAARCRGARRGRLSHHRPGQHRARGAGGGVTRRLGPRRSRCRTARGSEIRLPRARQALHDLHADRGPVRPGQFLRCLPGAARSGARPERGRHPWRCLSLST